MDHMDKQTYLEKMLYSYMMNRTDLSENLKKATSENPEWHKEHLQSVEEMTLASIKGKSEENNTPPAGRQRLDSGGASLVTKGEAVNEEELPHFDDRNDVKNLQERLEKIEVRLSKLEVTATFSALQK